MYSKVTTSVPTWIRENLRNGFGFEYWVMHKWLFKADRPIILVIGQLGDYRLQFKEGIGGTYIILQLSAHAKYQ